MPASAVSMPTDGALRWTGAAAGRGAGVGDHHAAAPPRRGAAARARTVAEGAMSGRRTGPAASEPRRPTGAWRRARRGERPAGPSVRARRLHPPRTAPAGRGRTGGVEHRRARSGRRRVVQHEQAVDPTRPPGRELRRLDRRVRRARAVDGPAGTVDRTAPPAEGRRGRRRGRRPGPRRRSGRPRRPASTRTRAVPARRCAEVVGSTVRDRSANGPLIATVRAPPARSSIRAERAGGVAGARRPRGRSPRSCRVRARGTR